MSASSGKTPILNGLLQSNLDCANFQLLNLGGSVGLGTVTSVGLTTPGMFSVSGSPITGAGTLALALSNQSANTIFGNLTSGSAAPTFATLATLSTQMGLAPSATTDTTNATNITSGTLLTSVFPATVVRTDKANTFGQYAQQFQAGNYLILTDSADTTKQAKLNLANITTGNTRTLTIPDGACTAVVSATAPANNYLTGVNSNGILTYLQPSFSDLQGTLNSAQLPTPGAGSLGGVKSLALVSHQFLTSIGTDGGPTQAQPSFSDISGTLTVGSGGTGQTTANSALNAFLPSQTSNSGKFLTTDGAGTTSWATVSGGGSFTSFSIVAANGFYGSVANATTAPALTLYLADSGDTTKKAHFVVSGVTAGQDRAITVPDAASTLVVSDTGASNNFLTAISASGAISKAQPSASSLSNGVTGSGSVVLASSPSLTTPNIGAATATQISGLTSAITPNAAGGTDIGSAALPLANIYVGGAATNNNKITSAVTAAARTFTLPDANSNSVIPDTGASNNFLTAISSGGVISKAQPAFSNISGTATAAQGGTGVSNSSTITLGGAISTANSLTTSGNFALTLTQTGSTNVTLPTTGTLAVTAQATDTFGAPTDVTTNNATTSAHGFLKKLDNTAAHYMDGTGSWSTPGASGGWDSTYTVSGSDFTTTSTTLVDITGLSFAALINSVYEFESVLLCSTSADANGIKFGVQYSAAGASVAATFMAAASNTGAAIASTNALNSAATAAFLLTTSQIGSVTIKGHLTTGVNTGNITIQCLHPVSGTSTIKIGSILKIKKVA